MIDHKVIIVGAGPAGSSCAHALKRKGIDCLILDKQSFPRNKLCAGWITPQVLDDLGIAIQDYPHPLTRFDRFFVHVKSVDLKVDVCQYAIRRQEFDHWLLERSEVPVQTHRVKEIVIKDNRYVLDDKYRCEYLVGAGGAHCPVYQNLFRQEKPRNKKDLIVTLELEFPYEYRNPHCHLWFFKNHLPGYSWYVPKREGILNIGIGGYLEKLKRKDHIKRQWRLFTSELQTQNFITDLPGEPGAAIYYIRGDSDHARIGNAFIVGDAAALATRDMGEGIGPAIQSGKLTAESIATGTPFSLHSVKRFSFSKPQILSKLFIASLFLYGHKIRRRIGM